jgi:hypothetical protein
MYQKRNIRLLISLCVLSILTAVLMFWMNRSANVTVDKSILRAEDLKAINKVILEKEGEKIELSFDGARWKVNDQLADRSMIDVLFATLQQAEPKREVSEKLADTLKAELKASGVHVTLLKDNQTELSFWAGGNNAKTQAYFARESTDEVYVMVIPGYRVYTSGIFELEESGWKDKYVFNFNWRNFQSLNVIAADTPENSFEIAMGKSYFEVKGLAHVDTTRLNDYIDAVSLLTVDYYLTKAESQQYDSVFAADNGFEIKVSDIGNRSYSLKLYPQADEQQVLGVFQGSQAARFDARKIAPLLKTRSWFESKQPQ